MGIIEQYKERNESFMDREMKRRDKPIKLEVYDVERTLTQRLTPRILTKTRRAIREKIRPTLSKIAPYARAAEESVRKTGHKIENRLGRIKTTHKSEFQSTKGRKMKPYMPKPYKLRM